MKVFPPLYSFSKRAVSSVDDLPLNTEYLPPGKAQPVHVLQNHFFRSEMSLNVNPRVILWFSLAATRSVVGFGAEKKGFDNCVPSHIVRPLLILALH
jgi:hypothetical protein